MQQIATGIQVAKIIVEGEFPVFQGKLVPDLTIHPFHLDGTIRYSGAHQIADGGFQGRRRQVNTTGLGINRSSVGNDAAPVCLHLQTDNFLSKGIVHDGMWPGAGCSDWFCAFTKSPGIPIYGPKVKNRIIGNGKNLIAPQTRIRHNAEFYIRPLEF